MASSTTSKQDKEAAKDIDITGNREVSGSGADAPTIATTQGDTRTSVPQVTTDLGLSDANPGGKGQVVNRPGVPGQSLDRAQHEDRGDDAPVINAFASVRAGKNNGRYGLVETIHDGKVVIRTRDDHNELIEADWKDVVRDRAGGRR